MVWIQTARLKKQSLADKNAWSSHCGEIQELTADRRGKMMRTSEWTGSHEGKENLECSRRALQAIPARGQCCEHVWSVAGCRLPGGIKYSAAYLKFRTVFSMICYEIDSDLMSLACLLMRGVCQVTSSISVWFRSNFSCCCVILRRSTNRYEIVRLCGQTLLYFSYSGTK